MNQIEIKDSSGKITLVDTLPERILLHKDSILVGERMRTELGDLNELADSIKEFGLIHPVAIDEKRNLVAGGRRFAAMTTILKMDWIPVTMVKTDGSETKLRIMEIEENLKRKSMNWKERCIATANIHRLHKKENALFGKNWTVQQTGSLMELSVGNIQYCLDIARELNDPNSVVHKAESLNDALQQLAAKRLAAATLKCSTFAQNIGRSMQTLPTIAAPATLSMDALLGIAPTATDPNIDNELNALLGGDGTPSLIVQPAAASASVDPRPLLTIDLKNYLLPGSCITHMKNMAVESVDHIVTDIPYAIDMDVLAQPNMGHTQVEMVREEHGVQSNLDLITEMLPLMYRVLKPNSFCVLCYDLDTHEMLKTLAEACGFKVCRWPLVWVKAHRCMNMSAQYNFTKATEFAMVLRKGNITLTSPQGVNYWMGGNTEAVARFKHPFAKPVDFWKWILSAVAIRGQTIYDPFAGGGSCVVAAIEAGFTPLASELDTEHFMNLNDHVRIALSKFFPDRQLTFA